MAVPARPRLGRRDPAPPRRDADAAAARRRRAGARGGRADARRSACCSRPAAPARPPPPPRSSACASPPGVDDDLRPFYERFADDPVIGIAVRSRPHVRIHRRADPWEALAWSITEQLIELERALVIQRRLVVRLGRRCPHSGLRDMPTPAQVAALAPAELQSYDLAARRALALRRAAREIAAGRVDLGRPRARLAAPARDPEHRPVDARDARRSTARATTTASRPATSATSSSWAGSPPATRRRAPTRPRCAASSSATASGRAWRGRT